MYLTVYLYDFKANMMTNYLIIIQMSNLRKRIHCFQPKSSMGYRPYSSCITGEQPKEENKL